MQTLLIKLLIPLASSLMSLVGAVSPTLIVEIDSFLKMLQAKAAATPNPVDDIATGMLVKFWDAMRGKVILEEEPVPEITPTSEPPDAGG